LQAHEQRQIAEKYATEAKREANAAFELAQQAVAKEEKAHVISHEAMKLVQHVDNGEAKAVSDYQAKARTAKADFFIAMENNKSTKKEEVKLTGEKKVLDPKVKTAAEETLKAQEKYDESFEKARTDGWKARLAKDRAAGVHSRTTTDQSVSEDQNRYAKAKLQEAIDKLTAANADATTQKAAYDAAANAAEEADENNFFSAQVKEAEAREKRANEAKAVADAQNKERAAAAAAAKASAAVAEAGDNAAQAIATAKQAAQDAQTAAELASAEAEKALIEARSAKKAADTARAAMKGRGAAAEAGLAAVNLENTARAAVNKLGERATKLRQTAQKFRQNAAGKLIKMDGDTALLARAKKAAGQAGSYHKKSVEERTAAQKALDSLQAKMKKLKEEWTAGKVAEQDAITALGVSRKDMDDSASMLKMTDGALAKVVKARRNAWKSAYKTETANTHLTKAAQKIARISTEEKVLAKKRKNKAAAGVKAAKLMLLDKATIHTRSLKAVEVAKDSGDADAVATATRAEKAASSAKKAAAGAKSSAETAYDIVVAQCAKKVEAVATLDRAVQKMGKADKSVSSALKLGAQANKMMTTSRAAHKKAQELTAEAKKEHAYRANDLQAKTENRQRLDKLIASSLVEEQRKIRNLGRAKKIETTWTGMKKQTEDYVPEVQKIYTETKAVFTGANKEAKKNEDAAKGVLAEEAAKQKEVDASRSSVSTLASTAGKDMVGKLYQIRSKWAAVVAKISKARKQYWDKQVEAALPLLMAATTAEAAAQRKYDSEAAKQDNMEAAAVGPRNRLKIVLVVKQDEEAKLKKEQKALDSKLTTTTKKQKKYQKELERLEKLRRSSALEALTLRVESIWKKRSKLHDPNRKQRLERSVYKVITAAWDRDGTPLGPGKLDHWYLDGSKITYAHKNQPGFLKEEVISRCSSACSEYADLQCTEGKVARACTRGRVYRARFQRTGTISAQNDWFVCRCNSGVMQFAARETLDVVRQKNRLLQASITPDGITFDSRLHAEEMMPDNHVHCFRDFEKWLTTKTPFAKPTKKKFAELDALALSKPDKAVEAYDKVKKMWYDGCIKEAEPAGPPKGTHPGSTDGSLDIFSLKDQSYTTLDVKKHKSKAKAQPK